MHGSAEDVYDYQSIRTSPKVQCDSTDLSCIEGFLDHHPSEDADNRKTTNLPENKLNFLSLITGKDFIGTEMEKRKDYPETVSVSAVQIYVQKFLNCFLFLKLEKK